MISIWCKPLFISAFAIKSFQASALINTFVTAKINVVGRFEVL